MIDRRVFSLAVVVCCLFAMVSMSASLESTIETQPGEAIELDFASLPLGVGEASELKNSYHSVGSAENGKDATASQTSGQGSTSERSGGGNGAEQGSIADRSGEADETQASGGAEGSERSGGAGDAEAAGTGGLGDDQGLLAVLRDLLSTLGPLLVWLGVAVTVLILLARRDRIVEWVKRRLRAYWGLADDTTANASDQPFRPPENVVERSWLELVSRADVDPEPSATPRETAAELVDAGFDRHAVWELTELFEEIRYDDAPITAERAHRTLNCLQRCRQTEVTSE